MRSTALVRRRSVSSGGGLNLGRLSAVLLLIALVGCSAGARARGPGPEASWPSIPSGHGRLVMFGNDYGWEGLLAGVTWEPELAVDEKLIEHSNGSEIVFYVDLPAGPHRITIDGKDPLEVNLAANELAYVEMQRMTVRPTGLSLASFEYKLRLLPVPPAYAASRTPQMKRVDARLGR